MTLSSIILSFSVGALIGIIYSYLFLYEKHTLLAQHKYDDATPNLKKTIIRSIISIVRLAFLAIVWLCILRWESIQFILTLPTFLMTFWLVLLKQKARLNERH